MITLVNGKHDDHIAVADRGFQYGDGLFETIAVHRGTPLLWARHLQRLEIDCQRLQLDMPDSHLLLKELTQVCADTERAVVKIILTHGPSGRGYARTANSPATRAITSFALSGFAAATTSRARTATYRVTRVSLRIKSSAFALADEAVEQASCLQVELVMKVQDHQMSAETFLHLLFAVPRVIGQLLNRARVARLQRSQ